MIDSRWFARDSTLVSLFFVGFLSRIAQLRRRRRKKVARCETSGIGKCNHSRSEVPDVPRLATLFVPLRGNMEFQSVLIVFFIFLLAAFFVFADFDFAPVGQRVVAFDHDGLAAFET